jgi:hypothetical protein
MRLLCAAVTGYAKVLVCLVEQERDAVQIAAGHGFMRLTPACDQLLQGERNRRVSCAVS